MCLYAAFVLLAVFNLAGLVLMGLQPSSPAAADGDVHKSGTTNNNSNNVMKSGGTNPEASGNNRPFQSSRSVQGAQI